MSEPGEYTPPEQVEYDVHLSSESQPGLLGELVGTIQQLGSSVALHSQGEALAPGVTPREPVALGEQNYLSRDHPTLKAYVTDQMDPAVADEAGAAWTEYGNFLAESAGELQSAASASEAEWQGEAAAAMRTKMGNVAQWSGETGQAAQAAGNGLGQQALAGDRARNSMPEPVEYNPWAMLAEAALSPNPLDLVTIGPEIIARRNEANEAHQQAAQVVTTLDGEYRSADAAMPMFAPPPELNGGPPAPGPAPGPGGGGRGGGTDVPPIGSGGAGGGGGAAVAPAAVTPAAFTPPAGAGGVTGGGGGAGGGIGTSGQSAPTGPGFTGVPSPGGIRGGAGGRTRGQADGVGGVPVGGRAGAGGGAGFRGGTGGGRFGSGAAGGSAGGAGRAGFGPSNPGGGAAGAGGGPRSGLGSGLGPTGTGGAAGAGGRGGAGGYGAPMMGGGGGRGQGDSERTRPSWLIEQDETAIIGKIDAVAPPVIGEDPDVYQR